MIVTVPNPRRAMKGGSVDTCDFEDVGGCTDVSWGADGALLVEFDHDLTPDEQATVALRCQSLNSVEEGLRRKARAALTRNRDYLAIPAPTNAQAVAQVTALTRQVTELARIILQDLDGPEGT